MKTTIAFVFALALCGCPPQAVQPSPDASDAAVGLDGAVPPPVGIGEAGPLDQADAVCLHLASIGCAQPATCAAVIRAKSGVFTNFNLPCLLSSSSVAAAIGCGSVKCGDAGQ